MSPTHSLGHLTFFHAKRKLNLCGGTVDFQLNEEQLQLKKSCARIRRARDRSQRNEVGRGQRVSAWPPSRNWASWGCWAQFFRRSTAAPAWATSNTSSPSKNCRGWMDRSASLSRRTLHSARTIFLSPVTKTRRRNTSASWPRESSSAHGD